MKRHPARSLTPLWIISLFLSLTEVVLGVAVTQKRYLDDGQLYDDIRNTVKSEVRSDAVISDLVKTVSTEASASAKDDIARVLENAAERVSLDQAVGPFTYGTRWVLRDPRTGYEFHELRPREVDGDVIRNDRPLPESGLNPGMIVEVVPVA